MDLEKSVRELKGKFEVSDWLCRRILKMYDGNVGTASHRLMTEDIPRLEESERRLALDTGEDRGIFRESGRRDGRDAAKADIRKDEMAWLIPKRFSEAHDLCLKCHRMTPAPKKLLQRLKPRCCLGAVRVPVRTTDRLTEEESRGFCEGYNGVLSRHVRERMNKDFDPKRIHR